MANALTLQRREDTKNLRNRSIEKPGASWELIAGEPKPQE
jgi:hypothetical protein